MPLTAADDKYPQVGRIERFGCHCAPCLHGMKWGLDDDEEEQSDSQSEEHAFWLRC